MFLKTVITLTNKGVGNSELPVISLEHAAEAVNRIGGIIRAFDPRTRALTSVVMGIVVSQSALGENKPRK